MGKSICDIAKKKRGRPKTTGLGTGILVRMHDQLENLDKWIEEHGDKSLTRPEAIRRLVELALVGATDRPRVLSTAKDASARAAELAGKTIDGQIDPSASADERTVRKRKLLKGPSMVREVRKDRLK